MESLKHNRYSTKSDIWSFGVCMWEIFSRGEDPFLADLMPVAKDKLVEKMIKLLERGDRLPQLPPEKCSQNIYTKLMIPCWRSNSDERLKFHEIGEKIKEILSEEYNPNEEEESNQYTNMSSQIMNNQL